MESRAFSIRVHRLPAIGVLLAIVLFSPGRAAAQATGSGPNCRFGFTGNSLGVGSISASFYRSGYPTSPQRCTIGVNVGDVPNLMARTMRDRISRNTAPLPGGCTNPTLGSLNSNLFSNEPNENRLCVKRVTGNSVTQWGVACSSGIAVSITNLGSGLTCSPPPPPPPGGGGLAPPPPPPILGVQGTPGQSATMLVQTPGFPVVTIPVPPGTALEDLGHLLAAGLNNAGYTAFFFGVTPALVDTTAGDVVHVEIQKDPLGAEVPEISTFIYHLGPANQPQAGGNLYYEAILREEVVEPIPSVTPAGQALLALLLLLGGAFLIFRRERRTAGSR